MKQVFALLALLLGFQFAMAQANPQTGPTLPGIVKTAEHVKTNVYDIQIIGIASAEQAKALDTALRAKHGILSAVTNPTTQVCRLEALKKVTEAHLQDAVSAAGFKIAKTFNQ